MRPALPFAAALCTALLAAGPAPAGAPLVCFPIEVADAAQLPFEPGHESKPAVPLDELPPRLARLFAEHSDAQLHMEALRRASFALESERCAGPRGAPEPTTWARLLAALEGAVVDAELLAAEPAHAQRRALAWFDLGYAREVGATMGLTKERGGACLRRACALAPDDAAIRFGAAIAAFQESRIERRDGAAPASAGDWREHLRRAIVAPSPLLLRNLLGTFGAFLDCHTHEALRAAVADAEPRRSR